MTDVNLLQLRFIVMERDPETGARSVCDIFEPFGNSWSGSSHLWEAAKREFLRIMYRWQDHEGVEIIVESLSPDRKLIGSVRNFHNMLAVRGRVQMFWDIMHGLRSEPGGETAWQRLQKNDPVLATAIHDDMVCRMMDTLDQQCTDILNSQSPDALVITVKDFVKRADEVSTDEEPSQCDQRDVKRP